jgi:predicted RNase H-like nuclease (RuvC/YqgF family)
MTPGAHGPDDPSDWDLRRVVEALVERCDRLEETVDRLTAENAELRAENQDLKDEIARLKGHPPRPKFKTKPSGMEKATSRSKRAKAEGATRFGQGEAGCHLGGETQGRSASGIAFQGL